jgi:hypothetical protein
VVLTTPAGPVVGELKWQNDGRDAVSVVARLKTSTATMFTLCEVFAFRLMSEMTAREGAWAKAAEKGSSNTMPSVRNLSTDFMGPP